MKLRPLPFLVVLAAGCGASSSGGTPDAGPALCATPGSLVTTTTQSGSAKGKLTVTMVTPDPGNVSKTTQPYVVNNEDFGSKTCEDHLYTAPVSLSVGGTNNFPVQTYDKWVVTSVVTGEVGGPYGPGCSYTVNYYLTYTPGTSLIPPEPQGCKWTIETTVVLFD